MYNAIVNPVNNQIYSLNSKMGKRILRNYISVIIHKGGSGMNNNLAEMRRIQRGNNNDYVPSDTALKRGVGAAVVLTSPVWLPIYGSSILFKKLYNMDYSKMNPMTFKRRRSNLLKVHALEKYIANIFKTLPKNKDLNEKEIHDKIVEQFDYLINHYEDNFPSEFDGDKELDDSSIKYLVEEMRRRFGYYEHELPYYTPAAAKDAAAKAKPATSTSNSMYNRFMRR